MRVAWAGIAGFLAVWLSGYVVIPWLAHLKFGQPVRSVGPERHLAKSGTPTMGGLMFVLPLPVLVAIASPTQFEAWALVVLVWGYGAIGFVDDYRKVVQKRSLGLRAREKLLYQILVAGLFIGMSWHQIGGGVPMPLPFGLPTIQAGWWMAPLAVLAVIATANAVNLTDGLDGLATGATAIGLAVLGLLSARGGDSATGVATGLVGSLIGFLRFNLHPAKVFMGDTGSLALGAALAGLAIATHMVFFLPIIGILFVLETLSVIFQVLSFRLTGRRLFRMSPLHHHFELSGWSEERVVWTFWMVAALGAVAAWIG